MEWSTIFRFELFGFVWWYYLVMLAFTIYTIVKACRTYEKFDWVDEYRNRSDKGKWGEAIRGSLYPGQTYFRIWDIIRTPFMLPGFVLGFMFFLLKAGAWRFIPVLRKVFGVKLFKIGKGD